MMIFTLPKPLPDSDRVFSWLIVGGLCLGRYCPIPNGKQGLWKKVFMA